MTYITYLAKQNWMIRIAHSLKWSALRRIGNLPIMRAVMLAPILAYIILFNDYAFEFFGQITHNIDSRSSVGNNLTNIYFLYFGLIFLGIASILYGISCPPVIARSADGGSFSQATLAMNASTITMSYLMDVLEMFVHNDERSDENETADYSETTRILTSQLVIEIYKVFLADDPKINDEGDTEWMEFHGSFHTGSGYFIAENIAKCVYNAPKVVWAFTEPYKAIAAKTFVADIAFLKYEIDDYSRLLSRLLITLFYIMGFFLLAIPSVFSFLKICSAMYHLLLG